MKGIKVFKTMKNFGRSYAILPAFSRGARQCRLLYLTAGPNKDLDQWKEKLLGLNTPKFYHDPPKWVMEEEKIFWGDWAITWSALDTPGETCYTLHVNIHNPDLFLYEVWDIEGGYHTRPGRYSLDYQVLSPADKICWKEGTWRKFDTREATIASLVSKERIKERIENKKKEDEGEL